MAGKIKKGSQRYYCQKLGISRYELKKNLEENGEEAILKRIEELEKEEQKQLFHSHETIDNTKRFNMKQKLEKNAQDFINSHGYLEEVTFKKVETSVSLKKSYQKKKSFTTFFEENEKEYEQFSEDTQYSNESLCEHINEKCRKMIFLSSKMLFEVLKKDLPSTSIPKRVIATAINILTNKDAMLLGINASKKSLRNVSEKNLENHEL